MSDMTRERAKEVLEMMLDDENVRKVLLRTDVDAIKIAISVLPDPSGVKNYTVEKLNQILEWGYCFCDTDDNEFCKAIKNAIEIITALERLKAEIRDNANHCECVPDGSCIRVDKVLEIIDKHIGGKDK